jgi:tRNA-dihydrouridine synthase
VKLLLAPMAELSHRALRELIETFGGCDEYWTEMINAGSLVSGGRFEHWYTDSAPCPQKLVFQLVGSEPKHIVQAAALLDQQECAGIDLNMGCSAPAITRTGAGVRWMEDVDKAAALVSKVRAVVTHRLSIKIRLGMTDDYDYLVRFCTRLEAEGVDLITLHPRTAREKFKRSARWNYVVHLATALKIPVAGNGDILTGHEALRRVAETKSATIMIGRAAVRMPWIFSQAKETAPAFVDLEQTALQFLSLLAQYQPAEFQYSRACRFFTLFCDNVTWAHYLKNLLYKQPQRAGMEAVLVRYFHDNEEDRLCRLT